MYLVVLFCPPIYFLVRKKWGGFVLNSILLTIALFTMLIFGIGFIFWALAVGHAGWELRKEGMQEHAELIAKEMVKAQAEAEAKKQEQPQEG